MARILQCRNDFVQTHRTPDFITHSSSAMMSDLIFLWTYELAVQFYRESRGLRLLRHLKDQFDRAASSIALNFREGSAKSGKKDRLWIYEIALGSIRECQAIFALERIEGPSTKPLDATAASCYQLCRALRS